jgi:hypothetical protein
MRTLLALCGTAAVVALQTGCAATASPNTDAQLGDSMRIIKAQQSIDPAASRRHGTAVPTTDGRLVRGAVDSLREASKTPAPSTVINVGGGGSGQ